MHEVFLYAPNLIGYARVALLAVSYWLVPARLTAFAGCYLLSFALDFADGWAARRLDQASVFGEYLDMLTDRVGTLLLAFIGARLPRARLPGLLVLYAVIDVVSHWLQQVVAARGGSHHKRTRSPFALLNLYYADRRLMGVLCLGAELFFVAYVCAAARGAPAAWALCALCLPVAAGKFGMNALQLLSNCLALAAERPRPSP